jgi:hypothetical protein
MKKTQKKKKKKKKRRNVYSGGGGSGGGGTRRQIVEVGDGALNDREAEERVGFRGRITDHTRRRSDPQRHVNIILHFKLDADVIQLTRGVVLGERRRDGERRPKPLGEIAPHLNRTSLPEIRANLDAHQRLSKVRVGGREKESYIGVKAHEEEDEALFIRIHVCGQGQRTTPSQDMMLMLSPSLFLDRGGLYPSEKKKQEGLEAVTKRSLSVWRNCGYRGRCWLWSYRRVTWVRR